MRANCSPLHPQHWRCSIDPASKQGATVCLSARAQANVLRERSRVGVVGRSGALVIDNIGLKCSPIPRHVADSCRAGLAPDRPFCPPIICRSSPVRRHSDREGLHIPAAVSNDCTSGQGRPPRGNDRGDIGSCVARLSLLLRRPSRTAPRASAGRARPDRQQPLVRALLAARPPGPARTMRSALRMVRGGWAMHQA